MESSSPVVTPGATAATMVFRASATTRPARSRPSRSSSRSTVIDRSYSDDLSSLLHAGVLGSARGSPPPAQRGIMIFGHDAGDRAQRRLQFGEGLDRPGPPRGAAGDVADLRGRRPG